MLQKKKCTFEQNTRHIECNGFGM